MAKGINGEPIIGNFLISQKKGYISEEKLNFFYDTLNNLLPEGYYTNSRISLEDFCYQYNFLIKRYKDIVIPTADTNQFLRYFRLGFPDEIINVFDKAATIVEENVFSDTHEIQYIQYKAENELQKMKQKIRSAN